MANEKMKMNEVKTGLSNVYLLIESITEKETKTGKKYLTFKLSDGDTDFNAKMWDTNKEMFLIPEGEVFYCQISKGDFNGTPDYTIKQYREADPAEYCFDDFIRCAPLDGTIMYEELIQTAENLKNPDISQLLLAILKEKKEKLLYWSAAKSMHHNYRAGLLWHTLRMVRSAKQLFPVYPLLSKDYVLAGVILHDIGKLKELETTAIGNAEYTVDGTLFGHLLLGIQLVDQYAPSVNLTEEHKRNIEHIIASHHANPEWGAIQRPATAEAFFVSQLDLIDSQLFQYETATKTIEPGKLTMDRIYGLNQIRVYQPAE